MTRLLLIWLMSTVAAAGQVFPGSEEVGSAACRACHAEIFRRYSTTGMARTSGKIGSGSFREGFDRAAFSDAATGAEYRIAIMPNGYRLTFSREASGARGERLLTWFVGSGRVGRSYLFSIDGYLFQAPVSYYSQAVRWDLSPGYERYGSIHLTRAVEIACLQCHTSRLRPVAGTQNRFADPPFVDGISCERCHGPGRRHIARVNTQRGGSPDIVNPAKLDPLRRDSVCAQCHMTGAARIARARARSESYRPGLLLTDYSAFFVWSGEGSADMSVNSHFERFQQSACKIASGDQLWCGSCHDPHGEPEESARAAYYRARCANCHQPAACKERIEARRKTRDDCAGCHMPKNSVRDNLHAVFTDHRIPRRPGQAPTPSAAAGKSLVPFWKTAVDPRDLGLAYSTVAAGDAGREQIALDLLERAEKRDPSDIPVLAQLAQIYDRRGDEEKALSIYERIVHADAAEVPAKVNLAAYRIKRGHTQEAMRLWEDALSRNPGLTDVRINLAVAQFQSGDPNAARATLRRALELEPDQIMAKQLLAEIQAAGH